MARIRTIKPSFFTSLTVSTLTLHQRLTFIGLWTHSDDEGRSIYDPRLIRAALWPLDDRSVGDVESDIIALTDASLITHYTVSERSFLQVNGWAEHQKINRPKKSDYPPPPKGGPTPLKPPLTCSDEPSVNDHGLLTDETLREGKGKEGKGKEGSSRASALPSIFEVTEEMVVWAQTNAPAVTNLEFETEKFKDHHAAKGSKFKDWTRAWQTWMRNAQQYAEERQPKLRAVAGLSPEELHQRNINSYLYQ
ncbi:hypothetical protein LWF01_02805 [Saxibacter everestensis]|uniref:Uncharacterized protein n=1 Tax=Saxibacter everestensis TaxID=2909229 RepID=A0ABY8QUQ7_9MICO|nr:hypothetical protein LWF01_02805 [Brevibacteriaceae bacterium ZFBP1038]